MSETAPQPLLKTPPSEYCENEQIKIDARYAVGNLREQFADSSDQALAEAAEQIAKSHGIYLEYNRATTGKEKDWMYMVRVTIPGGGSLDAQQWAVLDAIADDYTANPDGLPSIRLTTRQNVQYHWVKKAAVPELLRRVAATGYFGLNGCGDNTRNVMACPLAAHTGLTDVNRLAHQTGNYFQLPMASHVQVFAIDLSKVRDPDIEDRPSNIEHFQYAPNLLNRKFKIAFTTVHRDPLTGRIYADNCVEMRTNDMGIAPVVEGDRVTGYQVYVGGGQGQRNGKPTMAALSLPIGVFTPDTLMQGLDAVVAVHQEWGDRKHRHWARLKYVVQAMGINWYAQQVRDRGVDFAPAIPDLDLGPRLMHHGWQNLPGGKLAYGLYVECGRLRDDNNGRSKSMVREVYRRFPTIKSLISANQDLIFTDLDPAMKPDFERTLRDFGYGQRNGKAYSTLRVLSGACVGLETCRLSYTESEKFEPVLMDELDAMGYGDRTESIGITGCERQCFRPATKTLGWIGAGPDLYCLKLGGSEDGSTQGYEISDGQKWYLRQVPREKVAAVCAFLFDFHDANKRPGESMGACVNRLGFGPILNALRQSPLADLLEKTRAAPYLPPEAQHLLPV